MTPNGRQWLAAVAMAVLAGGSAQQASAEDGVTEISQASLPPSLANGSYRLTSNLSYSGSSAPLRVSSTATSVTIDLNGFAVQCAGCDSSARGVGADDFLGIPARNLTIRDGTIRGFLVAVGPLGVSPQIPMDNVRIENVRMLAALCTNLGAGSTVVRSHCSGIYAVDDDSAVDESLGAAVNPGSPSFPQERLRITENVLNGGFNAIGFGYHSVVLGNVCNGHSDSGINAFDATLRGNVVNGNAVGIASARSTVVGNVVINNNDLGLENTSGDVGYSRNLFNANNGGNGNPQVSSSLLGFNPSETDPNVCGGDLVCP